jgi:hypothetical protein
MSTVLYLEHLTDTDLALLASVARDTTSASELLTRLRTEPGYLEALLKEPALFAALFQSGERDALLRASPFLVFAVLVHRTTQDLAQTRFVQEWVGPGRRMPMFEVTGLQKFVADSLRRLFLAELLASYTHVASGSVWVQTSRGWQRRRFSELDPLRLIELLDLLPEHERPSLYRRLGDLALFLTGVFPDYVGTRLFSPLKQRRIQHVLQWGEVGSESMPADPSSASIWLLEELGRRSYHLAWRSTEVAGLGLSGVLGDVAEGFGEARRILNFLTDRYLFPWREQWFPFTDT